MTRSPIDLLKDYQRSVYADPSRFVAWLAGRQVGKSFTAAMRFVAQAKNSRKEDFLIGSPSERQSLEAVAKCKQHVEAFGLAERIEEVVERDAPGALMKSDTIIFPNGSRIIAVPGKPDTVRGFSAHIWLDEFAFFEDPDATWKAIIPSISNPLKGPKRALLTSTPNGRSGRGKRFYDIITGKGTVDPEVMGTGYKAGEWSVHRTPITVAAPELGTDVEELRRAVDDEEAWQQEFLARFIDASNVLLPYDVIAKCESIEATTEVGMEWVVGGLRNPIYVGIDFGRTSDPTVCWILEKVGDVLWTRGVKVFRNMNTVDQFEALAPIIEHARRCAIDYTGPGVGFGDMVQRHLGAEKYTATGARPVHRNELCVFSRQFKCDIFPKLRTAFDGVKVRVPCDVEVREDLHEMQQVVSAGQYNYMARRTAEGHSDRCTALALAVHAASFGAPCYAQSARHFGRRFANGFFRRNSYRGFC